MKSIIKYKISHRWAICLCEKVPVFFFKLYGWTDRRLLICLSVSKSNFFLCVTWVNHSYNLRCVFMFQEPAYVLILSSRTQSLTLCVCVCTCYTGDGEKSTKAENGEANGVSRWERRGTRVLAQRETREGCWWCKEGNKTKNASCRQQGSCIYVTGQYWSHCSIKTAHRSNGSKVKMYIIVSFSFFSPEIWKKQIAHMNEWTEITHMNKWKHLFLYK